MTHTRTNKAFSIIELLVAMIILGILVAIIVPVLASRTEQARLRKAEADLERIQNALETASIDTGYYYRIHVLDDGPGGDGIGYGQLNDVIDGIQDEDQNSMAANPIQMFILPSTGQQVAVAQAASLFLSIQDNETRFNWQGPYVTYQKDATNINANNFPDNNPDDPWGNNYFFFTRAGLMLEYDINGNAVGLIVTTYNAANGTSYDCEVFDRATVLSLGPNGLPGDGTTGVDGRFGRGDDIKRSF